MGDSCWWVYVVECRDGTLYTGSTTDVTRRVHEHNSGKKGAKYTQSRRPVKLVTHFPAGSRSDALKQEYAFKQLTRKRKLQFIKDYCAACRSEPCDCNRIFGF